ncbi:serine/threonine-protein kinase [Novipirellula artificiosorum]|nr:serine/threonine-protein kinase [Novipirellula artificiosorum]
MTALLGKLRNAKPSSVAPAPDTLATAASASRSGSPSLEETHASQASPHSKTMSFAYPPGSTPLPRYTIRRGIGIGGFGEVYFAVSDAGKEVALKRIQRNLDVELRGVSHCLNLKHPNLVALYDICRDESNQAWVVMEYVAGKNLRQVLDESPNGLTEPEVRRWFTAIAAGVDHLHGAGLVHRDLKPGNVFDDLGIVKVGDYGLSKFISASHRGGHTESVGTFHYMAPEIGRGEYGREIDIYALGIVLYELQTGTVPFDGESCHEIIVKHMTASPDLSRIAEPYRTVIAKCLEKDPAKRYQRIVEMTDAIGVALPGRANAIGIQPRGSNAIEEPIQATLANAREHRATKDVADPSHAEPAVVTPTLPTHPAVPNRGPQTRHRDEPFARAVRDSLSDLERWWQSLDHSPGAKAFLMLVAVFVLIINTHWLLPLLTLIGFIYVPYYIVRQMILHVSQQPTYAQAQRLASAHAVPSRPLTRSQWRAHMRTDLRAKHTIHRAAELSTSWITAILTTLVLGIGAGVIGLRSGDVDAFTLAPYGSIMAIVMIASLAILGLGKLWERDEGESLPRRVALAGIGAGVGVTAYAVNQFLMLPLDVGLAREIDSTTLPQALYMGHEIPRASAMVAHFALLFASLRWWKPVDPLRRRRLSLWGVAVAVVVEWAIHQVLPIPQPAGMLVAGGIAIAIQLSAPWINPTRKSTVAERSKLRQPSTPGSSPASEPIGQAGGVV